MKKLLLAASIALALGATPASAQYFQLPFLNAGQNPGGQNTDVEYPVGGGLPTGWTTLFTGTAATLNAPVWSNIDAVPFAFQFNGQPATSYKVSSSGVLTFSTAAVAVPGSTNAALPSAQIPDKSVCVWGIGATTGDYIITKTFGTAPNRQHWIQFNSYSKPGNTSLFTYWSIVLEENTNNIYIVDQRTNATTGLGVTAGVQVNATTALQVAGSPALESRTASNAAVLDNSYWTFSPGTQRARDLKMTALTVNTVVGRTVAVPVTGRFQNMGTQAVTGYTVNYKVNNGTTVSGTVSGSSVAPLATSQFTHPTGWTPGARGTYNLKVWLSNPNGQPDEAPADDTLRVSVVARDSVMRRMVVFEGFTSSTCPPCVPGNANLLNVNRANKGKYVQVKYQQNFPAPGNDPYYTAEAGARLRYYLTPSAYVPYFAVDGGANGNFNGNSNDYAQPDFERAAAISASVRAQAAYTRQGNTITAYARFRALDALPSANLVAHVIVTERRTTKNARTNGETVFYDVMKKMLPNDSGTPVAPLVSGQTITLPPLTYTFATAAPAPTPTSQGSPEHIENLDSLRVIVFLQDRVTKEIFQGTSAVLNGPLSTTREQQSGQAFVLAPNPATGRTSLHFSLVRPETVRVEVLDALGRTVSVLAPAALGSGPRELPLHLAGQPAGLYLVRLTTTEGVSTRRLVLE